MAKTGIHPTSINHFRKSKPVIKHKPMENHQNHLGENVKVFSKPYIMDFPIRHAVLCHQTIR